MLEWVIVFVTNCGWLESLNQLNLLIQVSFLVLSLNLVFLSNVEAHVDYMDDIILFNYTGRYSCAK